MIERECVGCGTTFVYDPSRPNKTRCKPNCGRTRASHDGARVRRSLEHEVEFIAVDGEGINGDEYVEEWDEEIEDMVIRRVRSHQYVMLSVGDQTLHRDGERLRHEEIFQFLWDQYLEHPDAVFVGFFLGYDFSQWFKSLPEFKGFKLFHRKGIESRQPTNPDLKFPWPVRLGDWEFDILGLKRFKLRPYVKSEDAPTRIVNRKDGTQAVEKIPRPWMFVNDAGSFFQTSLMNAIDPKQWIEPIVTPTEYETLKVGKQHREDAAFDQDMIRYNLLENDVLSRLMTLVNQGFVADGIRLRRDQWFGPGQAAQKWLSNVGCPTGETIRELVPPWARDAARESYYGGWFEIFYHGLVPGETYAYDINSAYPAAIATLPCLLHGEWTQGEGTPKALPRGSYRLVDARVQGRHTVVGAMPHRTPQGIILRPRETSGWYWWHEVQAAKKAGIISKVKVDRWVDYRPCGCEPPLREIAELYEGRLKVNKNSPFGKSKKLIYNSSYGKLAQSIGMPRFSNPVYASLITAHCRAMILDAIATHPLKADGVVMVATDSVTFLEPHPAMTKGGPLNSETRLGAWDETVHHNLTLMMPGVYWDDASREKIRKQDDDLKVKSRGISGRDLASVIHRLDEKWARFQANTWCEDTADIVYMPWPAIEIPIRFGIISPKLATTQDRWDLCGRVVHDGVRRLNADPCSKRDEGAALRSTFRKGAVFTINFVRANEARSTPYAAAFGETEDADTLTRAERELLTQDSTVMQELAESIRP